MPIDYRHYPKNWKTEIRPRVLARAMNCCEFCDVPNESVGHRDAQGSFSECGTCYSGAGCDDPRPVKIVLTVAHLDHDISNNADDNLRALCQRCHLHLDRKQHTQNAAETRRRRRREAGQVDLF